MEKKCFLCKKIQLTYLNVTINLMSNVTCPLTLGFSESKPEVLKFYSYAKLIESTSTVSSLEKHV